MSDQNVQRIRALNDIIEFCKAHGGEMPNRGAMGTRTWFRLGDDFKPTCSCQACSASPHSQTTAEEYPGVPSYIIAGVPILLSQDLEEGVLALWNTRHPELLERTNGFDMIPRLGMK